MSGKERRRVSVLAAIKKGKLSLAKGAEAMGISYRQAKRIWKRYQLGGEIQSDRRAATASRSF